MNVKFHSVNNELIAVYEDGRVFVLIDYEWNPLPDLPV